MKGDKKRFLAAVSVLIGTCIGAGILGIPYVAAQSGFFIALAYIILLGIVVLLINLYLGEISLRTKGNYHLSGYARHYLGKKGEFLMTFATVFGIYSAIVAYLLGVSESLSFLFFGNFKHYVLIGVLFGLFMAFLIWKGIIYLKKFEKIGVSIVLFLLGVIFFVFIKEVNINNLYNLNTFNIFLPFGVVLFALLSFQAIPEVEMVLNNNKRLMKNVIITSTLISIFVYIIFTFVVVGVNGGDTPEVATLALGKIFVVLGIFTMFTSYLALGNALKIHFTFDDRFKKIKAWFYTTIVPIILFVITQFTGFFSFTKILSIGGVISGGMVGILVLMMVRNAKKKGDRKPEYSMPLNKIVIWLLILLFVGGIIQEIIRSLF